MLVFFVCFSLLVLISPVICLIPTAPNKRSRPGQGLRHPTVLSQMGFHPALENNNFLTPSCSSREIKLSDNLTVYDRLIARRCDFLLARMTGIFSPLSHCPMSSNPRQLLHSNQPLSAIARLLSPQGSASSSSSLPDCILQLLAAACKE